MNEQETHITIAPLLSDNNTLIIYRNNGIEVMIKINEQSNLITSTKKIYIDEMNFIRENYLNNK